jgi:hypothetical protein
MKPKDYWTIFGEVGVPLGIGLVLVLLVIVGVVVGKPSSSEMPTILGWSTFIAIVMAFGTAFVASAQAARG